MHSCCCHRYNFICCSLIFFLLSICLSYHCSHGQTAVWSTDDQEACIQQCMATGQNCSSGCGLPADCAPGWKGKIARRCYKIVYPTTPGYTWSQARQSCQVNNAGDLVSVHSQMENSFLYGLIVNTVNPDGKSHSFWTGMQLTRNAAGAVNGGSWADGSALDYANPVTGAGQYPWATGQPTTAGNCVRMMGFGPYLGLWYDANCNQATNLIPTIGYFCKGCPDGWSTFNGRCYKAFVSTSRAGTLVQFNRLCSIFNATMVSIHSAAENNFVLGLVQAVNPSISGYMIGLVLNRAPDGTIQSLSWTDGSPVDFGWNVAGGVYPWADTGTGFPGQPDNNPAPGVCTFAWLNGAVPGTNQPGRWDDITCNASPMTATVCKF